MTISGIMGQVDHRSTEKLQRRSSFYQRVKKSAVSEVTLREEIATCSSLLKKKSKRDARIYKYSVIQAIERLKPLVGNSNWGDVQ